MWKRGGSIGFANITSWAERPVFSGFFVFMRLALQK